MDDTVYALDSSTVDLCLSLFDWAPLRSTKAAIKLHTLLDLRGAIPAFIHALGIEQALLDQFGAAGLDGKVGLGESDGLLSRVTVPGDQVAGIAGEHQLIHLALAAGAEVDHIVDITK